MNEQSEELRRLREMNADLHNRLADLHFYEEIAEHYAKCAISPEALRDWVAERVNTPPLPVQPEPVAKLFGSLPVYETTPPQRPWVGLTDDDYKGMSVGDQVVAMWAERTLKEKNT